MDCGTGYRFHDENAHNVGYSQFRRWDCWQSGSNQRKLYLEWAVTYNDFDAEVSIF